MSLPDRPKPQGKKVSLFVTCMVDMLYPEIGLSVVEILEHLGLSVDFPMGQTCCGQPAFNAGFRAEAKTVAKTFLKAFAEAEVIVTPSGSCAAMVRHEYPTLFADDPIFGPQAERAAARTWEFSEFLVEGLGITELGLRLAEKNTFAFHDACHGLRLLGLGAAGRQLLAGVENAEIVTLPEADVCCGFGGLFSVKMADISGAMLERKMGHIEACPAACILTGDVSCMTHMNGGLTRAGSSKRVRHLAEILGQALRESK